MATKTAALLYVQREWPVWLLLFRVPLNQISIFDNGTCRQFGTGPCPTLQSKRFVFWHTTADFYPAEHSE